MKWSALALVIGIAILASCESTDTDPNDLPVAPNGTSSSSGGDGGDPTGDASGSSDGTADGDAKKPPPKGDGATSNLRIMAANITSGNLSTYDPGEGLRIFKGLHPDVALIQELNYLTNSDTDMQAFVSTGFGAGYTYYRETGFQIPNGIVSRYPITESGHWNDPNVNLNRGFAWAKIAVPGPHPLWAVSVHLVTSNATLRATEATAVVNELSKVVQDGDYVVIGGDLNTENRAEPCITTFSQVVSTGGPFPVDQQGSEFTSGPRTRPYDWVLTSPLLTSFQVSTIIGNNELPYGLVFDSRLYTPLEDVAPVLQTDSAAVNMQHMAVIRDFAIPSN